MNKLLIIMLVLLCGCIVDAEKREKSQQAEGCVDVRLVGSNVCPHPEQFMMAGGTGIICKCLITPEFMKLLCDPKETNE